MEEKTEKKEQTQVAEMLAIFNSGWETVVELVVRLTGLTREAARNTIVVASVPLLTTVVRIVNWAYLYVHYHLGYNVPVAYLTVDTSWLVSFGVGILLVMVFAFFCIYSFAHTKFISRFVVGLFVLSAFLFIMGANRLEFTGLFVRGLIWLCSFCCALLVLTRKCDEESEIKGKIAFYLTIALGVLVILGIFSWWFRALLAKWNLIQHIDVSLWLKIVLLGYAGLVAWSIILTHRPLWKRTVLLQVCLLFVSTIFSFILMDDCFTRSAPYAVTTDEQQVVVYQTNEICVLEAATMETDEETGKVALTIDTSQQQIVDITSLSYEYRSFDTVDVFEERSLWLFSEGVFPYYFFDNIIK